MTASKEKVEATQRPWHIRQGWSGENILIDCGDPAIPSSRGNVASVTSHARYMSVVSQQEEKQAQAEANAELIVRAVNSYDEREEACELTLDVCRLIREGNPVLSESTRAAMAVLEAEMERLLGKTTEESRK